MFNTNHATFKHGSKREFPVSVCSTFARALLTAGALVTPWLVPELLVGIRPFLMIMPGSNEMRVWNPLFVSCRGNSQRFVTEVPSSFAGELFVVQDHPRPASGTWTTHATPRNENASSRQKKQYTSSLPNMLQTGGHALTPLNYPSIMLASSFRTQSFLLLALVCAATILSASTTGVAAVGLQRFRFLGSVFKQQQYQSSRRELNQVNGFARCPPGCDLDASGCVQAGTPGGLRCEKCLNSLLVNKTTGACGG